MTDKLKRQITGKERDLIVAGLALLQQSNIRQTNNAANPDEVKEFYRGNVATIESLKHSIVNLELF